MVSVLNYLMINVLLVKRGIICVFLRKIFVDEEEKDVFGIFLNVYEVYICKIDLVRNKYSEF